MGRFKDLTGLRFGRILVVKRVENLGKKVAYQCKCDCETIKVVRATDLGRRINSCGCLQKEVASKSNSKHRKSGTRLYSIYKNMKSRCHNPNYKNYKFWGGKGITICNEWLDDFENFYEWSIKNGYKENLTLDRIDNDKDYTPDNCRWVPYSIQSANRDNTIKIKIDNEEKVLSEWARIYGFKPRTLHQRYASGDRGKELFRPLVGGEM